MITKVGIKNIYFTNHFKNHISEIMQPQKSWDKKLSLLDQMLFGSITNDFIHEVVQSLFKIIDEQKEDHMIGTAMAILTEIAQRISTGQIKLQQGTVGGLERSVLENISSNVLSRANINNNTVRLGIIHYLSVIKPVSRMELQRTLSRFGESLLTQVFLIYFSNKKESEIALHFLNSYLSEFLAGSAAVAEMTGSVLQKQMLKFPVEFPKLMKSYIKHIDPILTKNRPLVRALGIHLSFLMKTTCEIGQKELITEMFDITSSFIFSFQKSNPNEFLELKILFLDIVSSSKTIDAKNLILEFSKMKFNARAASTKNNISKMNSTSTQKITPLEEILFLAS